MDILWFKEHFFNLGVFAHDLFTSYHCLAHCGRGKAESAGNLLGRVYLTHAYDLADMVHLIQPSFLQPLVVLFRTGRQGQKPHDQLLVPGLSLLRKQGFGMVRVLYILVTVITPACRQAGLI